MTVQYDSAKWGYQRRIDLAENFFREPEGSGRKRGEIEKRTKDELQVRVESTTGE